MALYTTTAQWQPGARLPLGIIPVEPAVAERMNQRGFVMDARRIAFMPVDLTFFPRLADADRGIVHTASRQFHQLVQNILMQLARRPELVMKLGPDIQEGRH